MADELTADEIRTLLKLEPHATCGFVRMSYLSPQSIAAGGLPPPFSDGRPLGSALYFMVMPTAPVRLHRIRNDQLYHYYLGDPLEVLRARRRHDQARRRRPELARRGTAAALHPGQHVSYRAADGAAPLVSWREHRVAGGGSRRRRDRQCRRTGGEVSVNCRRPAGQSGIRPGLRVGAPAGTPFSPLAPPPPRGSAQAA